MGQREGRVGMNPEYQSGSGSCTGMETDIMNEYIHIHTYTYIH